MKAFNSIPPRNPYSVLLGLPLIVDQSVCPKHIASRLSTFPHLSPKIALSTHALVYNLATGPATPTSLSPFVSSVTTNTVSIRNTISLSSNNSQLDDTKVAPIFLVKTLGQSQNGCPYLLPQM